MNKKKKKVLPKSVFYLLCFGFFVYIGYLTASLIAPDGVVDEYIHNLPGWTKIIFFAIIGVFLAFELFNSIYGALNKKEK
jgi:TRAP-type C4-dicarboxylate transport system permease small subunit